MYKSASSKFNTLAFGTSREVKAKVTVNGKTYQDEIVSFKFSEAITSGQTIGIGETCANSLTLKLLFNSEMSLAGANILPYISYDGQEWCPLGSFFVSTVETSDNYKTVEVTAYDQMAYLNESYAGTGTTCFEVITYLAQKYSFSVADTEYPTEAVITSMECTCREMIGYVAGLMGKNARFNRDGKLEFNWFYQLDAVYGDVNMDDEINSEDIQYTNENLLGSASKTEAEAILGRMIVGKAFIGAQILDETRSTIADVNDDGIINNLDIAEIQAYINGQPYNPTKVGTVAKHLQRITDNEIYMDGLSQKSSYTISCLISGTDDNVITSGSGRSITFGNPFITQEILDRIKSEILPFTYFAGSVKYRGNPVYECGDIVRVLELDIPIMNQEFEFDGGLSATITSYGLSDEEIKLGEVPNATKNLERKITAVQNTLQGINNSLLSGDTGYMILDETEIDGVKRLSGFKLMNTPTVTGVTKGWLADLNGIGWSSDGFKTISKLGLDMANGKIYADEIAAGSVITNSFKIGDSDTDYAMSFDGDTGEITFGSKVKMSWASIEDQPDIPTNVSDLENDSGFINSTTATMITNNAISTATILASQVTAGSFTMTGGTININTGSKGVSKIKLNYNYKGETSYMELSDQGMTTEWTDGTLVAGAHVSQDSIGVKGPYTSNYSYMTGTTIVENGTALSNKYASKSDLSGYAYKSHTHSGNDISGGYPSVASVYLTSPGTASAVAVYRSTNSGILGIPSSSRRYKNSITDVIDEVLRPERLYDLPIRQYKWNEGQFDDEEDYDYSTINIGFIAEEVAEIYPFAAVVMNGEIETWEARNLLPPMLALIQEQHKDIEELKKKVEALS